MQQVFIIFMIIFMACQSSQEKSFNNLTQAFINWYYKYHPVESTRYNAGKYYGNYRPFHSDGLEEYSADISRFLIELSQIDETKLANDQQTDYEMLEAKLKKIKYNMQNIMPWEWNPLWSLNEIYDGMYLLSEGSYISMEDRVKAVELRLEKLPAILDISREMMVYKSPLHLELSQKISEKLKQLLLNLPLNITSDNAQLDHIDELIQDCISKLTDYDNWLVNEYKKLADVQFPKSLDLMAEGFQLYNGKKYIPSQVYHLAKKKVNPVQNRMFNLALPLYLQVNDEPVWLDRNDTLEVIGWAMDNLYRETVPRSNLLSAYYESITRLENFTVSHNLIGRNMNKPVRLEFTPDYFYQTQPAVLFDFHAKDKNKEAVYYIYPHPENLGYDSHIQLTEFGMDLFNMSALLPGFGTQLAYAQTQKSIVKYLFPDPITMAGWKYYAVNMLLDEGYGHWQEEYHLLKLQRELKTAVSAILEEEYYTGITNRQEAIQYFHEQAFLSWSDAEAALLESEQLFFTGTASFIGLMELKKLRTEFEKDSGQDYKLVDFHTLVLEEGIIPLHRIKDRLLSN